MTGYEYVMAAVLTALRASPPVVTLANVRRAHKTTIPRDKAPAVHLVDGEDDRDKKPACGKRRGNFTISIYVRSDDGASAADPYRITVCRRIENLGSSLPSGVMISPPGRISVESEIADADATRVDVEFSFTYQTRGEWSLELPE